MFINTLFTPTLLARTPYFYYLVDCWHNRVLFSPTLDCNLRHWRVLIHLPQPHSLATDGSVFVIDSTSSNRLFLFEAATNRQLDVISLPTSSVSPHYLYFSPQRQLFFCLCARSQTLLTMTVRHQRLVLRQEFPLTFLSGHYSRSFFCSLNDFYFPVSADAFSSPASAPIWQPEAAALIHARLTPQGFDLLQSYPLPLPLANPNFLFRHREFWYLSTTPSLFVRFRRLSDLARAKYQILNNQLGVSGTPYFLSQEEDQLYLPLIDQFSGLLYFSPSSLQSTIIFPPRRPNLLDRYIKNI
jgi:hypothetical protein